MRAVFLLVAAALLTGNAAAMQVRDDEPVTVERTVLLMRHGVRAPLSDPPLPAGAAAAPWPDWPVGRAELTPHGYAAVRLVGVYDRGTPKACPTPGSVVALADNDQRTIETARAWTEGFAPGCDIEVKHLPVGTPDPIFAPLEAAPDTADPAALTAGVERHLPPGGLAQVDAEARPLLARLDAVLCGDDPSLTCGVARTPTMLRAARRGREPALRGAMAEGATAAQALTLAYAEGMSPGWGRLHAGDLARLGALRSRLYQIIQRTPAIARAFGSTTLRRMADALDQAGLVTTTLLVGHDSNVAAVAGLLDLHWQAPGFAADDPTPSGAIILQTVRGSAGRRYVRAFYRSPALDQIRRLTPLVGTDVRQAMPIPACAPTPLRCPADRFMQIVNGVIGS